MTTIRSKIPANGNSAKHGMVKAPEQAPRINGKRVPTPSDKAKPRATTPADAAPTRAEFNRLTNMVAAMHSAMMSMAMAQPAVSSDTTPAPEALPAGSQIDEGMTGTSQPSAPIELPPGQPTAPSVLKTPEQQAVIDELRAKKQAKQAVTAPAAPPAAPTVQPEQEVEIIEPDSWFYHLPEAGAGRIALSILVPIAAAFTVGSLIFDLAAAGIALVATVSGFFLWPLLIGVLAAIVAVYAMYKLSGLLSRYIISGTADRHAKNVWGYLSSPFRSVEQGEATRNALASLIPRNPTGRVMP